jgi:hypothetical protein
MIKISKNRFLNFNAVVQVDDLRDEEPQCIYVIYALIQPPVGRQEPEYYPHLYREEFAGEEADFIIAWLEATTPTIAFEDSANAPRVPPGSRKVRLVPGAQVTKEE